MALRQILRFIWLRAVPCAPGVAPKDAATFPPKTLGGRDPQSIAFFRTPEMPWLYSGEAMSSPSHCLILARRAPRIAYRSNIRLKEPFLRLPAKARIRGWRSIIVPTL